jgi:hypothetical protein
VTPVEPRLTLGLPEREAYVDVTVPVPAGNRLAILVSAQREDFGGEVKLELKDLPPGIAAETMPLGPDDAMVPVLLTAAADAKPGGSLAALVGRHVEGSRTIEGRLRQRTSLVRGANNREVWNHYTERMATAVTQPVPLRLEIVQPKVPLVQSGSMELRIVAQRAAGFKAPITLHMLYNPPGVSTPSTVTIPEGRSEVLMPLTADGGAAVRKWKIAVVGETTVGDGAVLLSSQLADLEVAPPFVQFAFPTVTVDQGQQADLLVKIEKKKDFAGAAKVELLGLPNEATAPSREFTKDSTEVLFPIKTTANSPVGQHKSLLCRAVIVADGEPITHMLGTGELRIQKPLPPKPAEAAKPKPPPPKPQPQAAPKVLSRLEQLRQERKHATPAEKK